MQTLIRRRVLRRLIWVCNVCQCPQFHSPGLTDNPLSTALWRHSDKFSAAINKRYLDFVQASTLISLVHDNHLDNYLKEILAFVYYGSIVKNEPKNWNCMYFIWNYYYEPFRCSINFSTLHSLPFFSLTYLWRMDSSTLRLWTSPLQLEETSVYYLFIYHIL